ncbi:MAG TPA: GNAT family N-acetyltransferase [Devosia sp.]
MVRLAFKPVSKATGADFVRLFESPGGPSYCWCMWTRITKDEAKVTGDGKARKPLMLKRIDEGVPVGLLGYEAGDPIAWVSVASRETFTHVGGPQDEPGQKIWSITCMYLKRSHRGQGLAHQLIGAAIKFARSRKADILEAHAVEPDSPSYRNMGFIPAYEEAGFEKVEALGTRRTVMRLRLQQH